MYITDLWLAYEGHMEYLEFTGVIRKETGPDMGPVDDPDQFDQRVSALDGR